jgi:hypothetical protein
MECTSIIACSFFVNIQNTSQREGKWVLLLILDITGWNQLLISLFYTFYRLGESTYKTFYCTFITIAIGHLNHANLGWDYGLFGNVFNNPNAILGTSKKIPKK